MKPRLLKIDCETSPHRGYFWKLFDENISLDQLEEPSRIICFAAQWHGEKKVTFRAAWAGGRRAMLKTLRAMLEEADAVITFNGDHFDLPRINGELVELRLAPLPALTSIDLYKVVKKLGLASGKLAYVAPYLKIGEKVKHEGFPLWRAVMAGDRAARGRMRKYNIQDTVLLGDLYDVLAPYMTKHPRIRDGKKGECTHCGSNKLQSRGNRYTLSFKIERLQCTGCGKWQDGKRAKL